MAILGAEVNSRVLTKNYPGIDAWIPGVGAFQMTVAEKHGINDGVKKDVAMLGRGAETLYWLLPPLYYDSLKPSACDFEQYAVLIPYPE
jgi:hypothetical protein